MKILLGTEYSRHFAVEGVRKSLKDVGVKQTTKAGRQKMSVFEFSICGGRHGKRDKDDWHPPHIMDVAAGYGNTNYSRNIDDIDAIGMSKMFADLLTNSLNNNWEIKLNRRGGIAMNAIIL